MHPTSSARCVHFFYSMYGEGMGTLNVYLKNPTTEELVKIWETSGNQGNHWHRGDVTIPTGTHEYQVGYVISLILFSLGGLLSHCKLGNHLLYL